MPNPQDNGVTIKKMKTHSHDNVSGLIEQHEHAAIMKVINDAEAELLPGILDQESDWTRTKFPERMFRDNFLPIITGDAFTRLPPGMTEQQLSDQARAHWLSVARGPFNEVDVVNENQEVVFTMPAVLPTQQMQSLQGRAGDRPGDQRPMKTYAEEHARMKQTLPAVGNARLKVGLDRKIHDMFSGATTEDTDKKINTMLEYYGIDRKTVEANARALEAGNLDQVVTGDALRGAPGAKPGRSTAKPASSSQDPILGNTGMGEMSYD